MDFLSSIFGIVKNVSGIIYNWTFGYGSKEATKAREINDDTKSKDSFNEELQKQDLPSIRRDLSE